jgi:hypothetical protein
MGLGSGKAHVETAAFGRPAKPQASGLLHTLSKQGNLPSLDQAP